MLRGGDGWEAVVQAISGGGCRRFLSTPVVHRYLMRKWRGYGIDLVANAATNSIDNNWLAIFNHEHGDPATAVVLLLILVANVVFVLPVTRLEPLLLCCSAPLRVCTHLFSPPPRPLGALCPPLDAALQRALGSYWAELYAT